MYNRIDDGDNPEKPVVDEPQQPPQYSPQQLTSYPPPPQPQIGYAPQPQMGYAPQPIYPPPQPAGYPPPQPAGYPPPQPQIGYAPQPQPIYPTNNVSSSNSTTVILSQPQTVVKQVEGPRLWSTGICSCFEDCEVCCLGFFCPCVADCILSTDAGECCCVGSCCPIAIRTKIRTRHNIHGSILDDCCILAFCEPCAKCQMSREVKLRGM